MWSSFDAFSKSPGSLTSLPKTTNVNGHQALHVSECFQRSWALGRVLEKLVFLSGLRELNPCLAENRTPSYAVGSGESFQDSGTFIETPNRRALVMRTLTQRTPSLWEQPGLCVWHVDLRPGPTLLRRVSGQQQTCRTLGESGSLLSGILHCLFGFWLLLNYH